MIWVEELGGWETQTRQSAIDVMRDARLFTVDDPRFTTAQVIGRSMLSSDGPDHAAQRKPFVAPFDRAATTTIHRPALADLARRLITEIRPKRTADLRTALTGPMATAAILNALGMDTPIERMRVWYETIVDAVNDLSEGRPAQPSTAVDELADAIRAAASNPASMLASVTGPNVVSNTMVLLFGAIETGDGMIANLLWHLLTNPAQMSDLDQPGMLERAVEESLRLEPAAARVDRFATRNTTYGGANITAGDLVIVSLRRANRDATQYERPNKFIVDRPRGPSHLAFAVGPHACLGAHFARAEAMEAVLATLTLTDLTLISEEPPTGLIFRKPKSLIARWTA